MGVAQRVRLRVCTRCCEFVVSDKFCEAMESYKRWIRGNKDYVHSLESMANVSTSQFLVVSFFLFG